MNAPQCIRSTIRSLATGAGLAAGAYATYVGTTWYRCGQVRHVASHEDADPLLDRFMPEFDVVERHHVRVAAPAQITLAAACDMDLLRSTNVRGVIKVRELIFGSQPEETVLSQGLLAQVKALGWGVLAEIPGREIVFGAVTQPWMANVVFRALPADEFGAFHEPGYVKIIWTLRADPIGAAESMARTETRVVTTDPTARAKFRWYWSFLSPGIVLIRRVSLRLVKAEAELRVRKAGPERRTAELFNEGDIGMNPIVKTRQGEVRGSLANGVHTFKGIPYARHPSAPIGSDRHSRARSRPDRVRAMTAAASPATASSA